MGQSEELDLLGGKWQVFVHFDLTDRVVDVLPVPAEVLDPILDLLLRPLGEINRPQPGHILLRTRNQHQQQPILLLFELRLRLESLLHQRDVQRVEERRMPVQQFYPFLASHHPMWEKTYMEWLQKSYYWAGRLYM